MGIAFETHRVRVFDFRIPEVNTSKKPCLNIRCGHGATWHTAGRNRRGACQKPGCWCRKYQSPEPIADDAWVEGLERLRATGKRRAERGMPSKSLLPLLDHLPDGAVIIDVGCGDSGDRVVAEQLGLVAYGIDLFPPWLSWLTPGFAQGDALSLPFATASIDGIILHAVTSLIRPDRRPAMYREFARVAKPGCLFSMSLYWLADGWDVSAESEDGKIMAAGFHRLRKGKLYRRRHFD